MTTLESVRLVFAARWEFSALDHVLETTSAYLDAAVEMEMRRACRFNSTRLLERIWRSCEDAPVYWSRRSYLRADVHYNRFQFRFSMLEAAKHPDTGVVRWLFEHFQGCVVPREVVEYAAGASHVELLQFLEEHGEETLGGDGHVVMWGGCDMARAVENKRNDIVFWLYEHTRAPRNVDKMMEAAVKNGDLEMLEWIQAHFDVDADTPELMRAAIAADQLPVLDWLFQHGYVQGVDMALHKAVKKNRMNLVEWLINRKLVEAGRAIDSAANYGQLDIAKQLYERYWDVICVQQCYPLSLPVSPLFFRNWVSQQTILAAAVDGRLQVVRWLVETFGDDPDVDLFDNPHHERPLGINIMDEVAMNGRLDVLEYLQTCAACPPCTTAAMDRAAAYGHLDVVTWLHIHRSEGCTTDAMDLAASCGLLRMVQWLHHNRDEGCTTKAMDSAAQNGHLDVVQWLHSHRAEGCTTKAMNRAALFGHLDVVQWLHTNRSEGCTRNAMNGAAWEGHLEVVKWLHANRTEGCTTNAIDGAARYGNLDVIKWLHDNRPEGCTTDAIDLAAEEDEFEVVQWLHANRTEGCTSAAMDGAVLCGNFDLVLFLHSQYHEGCTERAFLNTDDEDEGQFTSTDGVPPEDIYAWIQEHYPENI